MWLDVDTESNWEKLFKFEEYPALIILNPGRRKRYVLHEGGLDFASIE